MSEEDAATSAPAVDTPLTTSTPRYAIAHGRVTMLAATAAGVASNSLKKGDVIATARYAGVQAAKQTASLVAEVASVTLSDVTLRFDVGDTWVDIEARVDGDVQVDIEGHALSAVSVGALTIYDMCKSADRTMSIGDVQLIESSGGRLGDWRRDEGRQSN